MTGSERQNDGDGEQSRGGHRSGAGRGGDVTATRIEWEDCGQVMNLYIDHYGLTVSLLNSDVKALTPVR